MPLPWAGKLRQRWPSQADPVTPWQGAATLWEQLRSDPEVRAMWWRTATILTLLCLGLAGIERIVILQRPTVEPYYVYVNQKGEVLGAENVGGKPYQPDEELLRHITQEWLEWVRAIPLDPQVLEKNWQKAIKMSAPPVAQRLYAYAKAIELTKLAKKAQERELAVKIVVESVLMLSERSLRIKWREELYDGNNAQKETATYTGEFELIVRKPENQKELDVNPLGIWMARYTWAKDMKE